MKNTNVKDKSSNMKKRDSLWTSPQLFTARLSRASQTLSEVPSDIIIESRIKYGNNCAACKGILMEYSKRTTVHGVRYLLEVHRPIHEKLYWCVIWLISLYFAITLIWATYLKWQDTPVILNFDETLVPVHKIPFPTVTICPEIKMYGDVFDFGEVAQIVYDEIYYTGTFGNNANLSNDKIENFVATLQLCVEDIQDLFVHNISVDVVPNITQILVDLSISKNKTAPFCKWNGRYYFCDKIFNLVATAEGICYQFNGLRNKDIYRDERYVSYSDPQLIDFNSYYDKAEQYNNITGTWSLKDGYINQGYNSYPQRTAFSSTRRAFFAFLHGYEHNIESNCRNFKQGYRIFLNSPESVPLTTENYVLLPHNTELIIKVLPQYIAASKNLENFSPEKRQCYFEDERYLRFFRSYSQSNCKVECLANYTISKCGCAKFWMPKPLNIPVCHHGNILCSRAAQNELDELLQNQETQKKAGDSKLMCNCMPACTSLYYDFEISLTSFDLRGTMKALREQPEYSDYLGSRITVTFKEHQFTAIKRIVVYSFTTFIANCGGIFNLFMGSSMLSAIELIYFFSVRLLFNLWKRSNTRKKMSMQEMTPENLHKKDRNGMLTS